MLLSTALVIPDNNSVCIVYCMVLLFIISFYFFYLILAVATLKCYHGGVGIIRSGVKETLIDAMFAVETSPSIININLLTSVMRTSRGSHEKS